MYFLIDLLYKTKAVNGYDEATSTVIVPLIVEMEIRSCPDTLARVYFRLKMHKSAIYVVNIL